MSFYGVTDVWTYAAGALGIILLPGPNSLFVLSVASARGVRAGYQGACGVFVGDSILLLCTALGAAGLLKANPLLFMVVKYAGAAYLAWLGLQLMRSAYRKWRQGGVYVPHAKTPTVPAHLAQPFRRALFISLLNPKAILFLLSFFVQFIDPDYANPAIPFLILSAIVMTLSALYLSALIFAGTRLAQAFGRRQRLSAGLNSAVGSLFVWFGVKLATASVG
jgi:leucine efflux protein